MDRVEIAEWIDEFFDMLQAEYRDFFRWISGWLRFLINSIEGFLAGEWGFLQEVAFFQANDWVLPMVVFLLFIIVAWFAAGWRMALFALVALGLLLNIGLWEAAIRTLSIVLASALICSAFGIPVGILMARSDTVETLVRPVLDFMQTMPAFVYLIPAVGLFGLGDAPATVATVIFAMPPIVRLTNHGIRTVDPEVVEASEAFGSNPWQTLVKVQFPLARPSIMLGLNQTLMLSLSMAVIAAMIGAAGLGTVVLRSLTSLDIGVGFEGGLGIVIVAVYLDRVTQGLGRLKEPGEAGVFKGFGKSLKRTFTAVAGGPWGRKQARDDEQVATAKPGTPTRMDRGRMPHIMVGLFALHAIILAALSLTFFVLLIFPERWPLGFIFLSASMILSAVVANGAWHRKKTAWYVALAMQVYVILAIILKRVVPGTDIPPPSGHIVLDAAYIAVAAAIVVYLSTAGAKAWFRIGKLVPG